MLETQSIGGCPSRCGFQIAANQRARSNVMQRLPWANLHHCDLCLRPLIGTVHDIHTDDQLLTVDELAEFLQVPKATIYGWRHKGDGPPGVKIGRYVRFRRGAVEDWIREREG